MTAPTIPHSFQKRARSLKPVQHGAYRLDPDRFTLFIDGQAVRLSPLQVILIHTLLAGPRRAEDLWRIAWGVAVPLDNDDRNTISANLSYLRRRLGPQRLRSTRMPTDGRRTQTWELA